MPGNRKLPVLSFNSEEQKQDKQTAEQFSCYKPQRSNSDIKPPYPTPFFGLTSNWIPLAINFSFRGAVLHLPSGFAGTMMVNSERKLINLQM
jgi:hypothetical protein